MISRSNLQCIYTALDCSFAAKHIGLTYKIVILAAAPTPTWHLRISGVSCAWFISVPIDLWGAINMRLHITCLALVFHTCFFLTSCGWPFLLAMAVNVTMSPERGSCIWRLIHGPRLPGESGVNKFKSTAPTLKSWICLWWTQTSFWVCAKILGGRVWPFTRPHALIFRADFGVHVRCYGRSGEMMNNMRMYFANWASLDMSWSWRRYSEIESSFCGNRTFGRQLCTLYEAVQWRLEGGDRSGISLAWDTKQGIAVFVSGNASAKSIIEHQTVSQCKQHNNIKQHFAYWSQWYHMEIHGHHGLGNHFRNYAKFLPSPSPVWTFSWEGDGSTQLQLIA